MERETGLEPATNSLEGCDSTNWVTPAFYLQYTKNNLKRIQHPPHYISNYFLRDLTDEVRTKLGFFLLHQFQYCGRRGIRTPKGVCQRIYSPPRLSNSGVRPDKFHPLIQKASFKYRMDSRKKQEMILKDFRNSLMPPQFPIQASVLDSFTNVLG